MSEHSGNREVVAATPILAPRNEPMDEVRAQLLRLQRHLAQVQPDSSDTQAVQLKQANEQLLLAALHAQRIAETAVDALHQSMARQDASAGQEPDSRNLREANEHLMIAALTAQEGEAQAERAHSRQIKLQAMVVHELRNPLAPIRIAAELLTRVHKGEPLLADLQVMIERQVVHMTRLIDDLLDGSRVSAGMFRLERSSVDMNGILMLAVEGCRPALDARSQQLTMQVPADLPRIDGDPVRLTQIFSNLLDNATKYTPEGGQIVLAAAVLDHALAITVSDNGIGISAEVLPTIFDLFVQDTHALVRRNSGLGIGLAVVRDLVEAHAGTVVGRSAGRNLGSEFVVTLPLRGGGGADCRLSRSERTFRINVLRSPSLPGAGDRILSLPRHSTRTCAVAARPDRAP